jgi:hypothetical protein
MRLRFAALMATMLLITIIVSTGCNKGTTSNSTNSTNANTASNSTSATTNTAQPSSTPIATTSAGAATPTEAFVAYYEAIKRQDLGAVKGLFSKGTLSMMEERAKQEKTTVDEVMKKGLEGAVKEVPAEVPETRNEKIEGDRATLEINDEKKDKWETLHFARENGQWKIAFDEP